MIHVICFYWQGDRWQEEGYRDEEGRVNPLQHHMDRVGQIPHDLPAQYVNNLYRGVFNHSTVPFKFICFTNEILDDLDEGIEIRPFRMITKDGVLPRLYMFSEEAGLFGNQVLCLDLDVVIVGSLSDIMSYDGHFCTRTKFKPGETHKIDGDIMSFKACQKTADQFYKAFVDDIPTAEALTQGRERYWVRHVTGGEADTWQALFPGQVLSYKWHVRRNRERVPQNGRIVSCHGQPRPHEIKSEWIKSYWN